MRFTLNIWLQKKCQMCNFLYNWTNLLAETDLILNSASHFFSFISGCRVIVFSICLSSSATFLLIMILPCKLMVILISACAGLILTCCFVTPFLLIARYHDTQFKDPSPEAEKGGGPRVVRGLGTDIAVAQSMVFVAQFALSLTKGPIQQLFGNYKGTCMLLGSMYCFIAAFVSLNIDYADL